MDKKLLILFILSYLIAFSINLMPSVKHPDLNMNAFNLLATILVLFVLLLFIKKGINRMKVIKRLKVFLIFGGLSGLLIYVVNLFENIMLNNVILDIIASVQYPFYLIFTTPLFGVNFVLNISYSTFALLTSLLYFFFFIIVASQKKVNTKSAQLN